MTLCIPGGVGNGGNKRAPTARKFSEFSKFYEVDWTQVIGKGGFSVVYRGRERISGRSVAIKKIPRRKNTQGKGKGSSNKVLKQEINAAIKVKEHPFIVSLLDVFVAADVVVLCMELMEGDVLFKVIVKEGPLAEIEAKKHFFHLAQALSHLHKNGISHRDIKLENLMFSNKNKDCLKLSDFGLSKILTDKDQQLMKTFCGTPAFLAPEGWSAQFQDRFYDNRVDTWSFGVTLFVAISGYHPFDPNGDSDMKTLRSNVLDIKWSFDDDQGWNSISTECKELLKSLLCNVKNRLSADEILGHSWFKANADVTDTSSASKNGKSLKRKKSSSLTQRLKSMQLGGKRLKKGSFLRLK